MILKKNYKNINDTLKHLKIQVIDSIPFACEVVPRFSDPEELFYWLKDRVNFRKDPRDTELLQTMQTMFGRKFWSDGIYGDCDCFVITTLACFVCQGWDQVGICLVGRERSHPVHIYSYIYWNGKRKIFDLTNRSFNEERNTYNYIQEIPAPWKKWNFRK